MMNNAQKNIFHSLRFYIKIHFFSTALVFLFLFIFDLVLYKVYFYEFFEQEIVIV